MSMTVDLDGFARFVDRVSLALGCPPSTHGDGVVSAALAQQARGGGSEENNFPPRAKRASVSRSGFSFGASGR